MHKFFALYFWLPPTASHTSCAAYFRWHGEVCIVILSHFFSAFAGKKSRRIGGCPHRAVKSNGLAQLTWRAFARHGQLCFVRGKPSFILRGLTSKTDLFDFNKPNLLNLFYLFQQLSNIARRQPVKAAFLPLLMLFQEHDLLFFSSKIVEKPFFNQAFVLR